MDTNTDNRLLIASAAKLYRLGVDLEGAREKLRRLTANGVPYESTEMLSALADFQTLKAQWSAAEKRYLALRDEHWRRK